LLQEPHGVIIFQKTLVIVTVVKTFTLKMEAICSSETSIVTRTIRRYHVLEDSILHCYRRENIKSNKDGNWFIWKGGQLVACDITVGDLRLRTDAQRETKNITGKRLFVLETYQAIQQRVNMRESA
jgi:hypothetical protein